MQIMIEIGYYVKPILLALMTLGSFVALPIIFEIDNEEEEII